MINKNLHNYGISSDTCHEHLLANSSVQQDHYPSGDADLGSTGSDHPNKPSTDVQLAWPNLHSHYPVYCWMVTPCLIKI